MIFLLDTNAVSDFMERHPVLDQHLAAIAPDDDVVTCTIVRGEILYGVECLPSGRRKDNLRATADATLNGFRCEPIPPGAAAHYARLKAASEQRRRSEPFS